MLTTDEVESRLLARFSEQHRRADVLDGFDHHVWSDGGEWPLLRHQVSLPAKRRIESVWTADATSCRDVNSATDTILTALDKLHAFCVTLPCGHGKSTSLMLKLLEAGNFSRIVCLQPSSIVADMLKEYLSTTQNIHHVTRDYPTHVRALHYLSAGQFLELLHSGANFDNTLLVIDECHTISPVYAVLHRVLQFTNAKILGMTASNSPVLLPRKGVIIKARERYDMSMHTNYTEALLESTVKPLIVGVHPNAKEHFAANHIVGLTMNVTKVFDFGTRLEPSICNNRIKYSYRPATALELTQTLGRLARTISTANEFHYVSKAAQYIDSNDTNLYTLIHAALSTAFSIDDSIDKSQIYDTLCCVRRLSNPNSSTLDVNLNGTNNNNKGKLLPARKLPDAVTLIDELPDSKNVLEPIEEIQPLKISRTVVNKSLRTTANYNWHLNQGFSNLSLSDRQIMMLQAMKEHQQTFAPLHKPEITLSNEEHLSSIEIDKINRIISGEFCVTYEQDEYNLVLKGYKRQMFISNGKPVNALFADKVMKYLHDYQTFHHRST